MADHRCFTGNIAVTLNGSACGGGVIAVRSVLW